jgi:polyisoprenoid-binding protein YceI
MKKTILTLALLASAISFAQTSTINVDTEKSVINWLAAKVTGEHNGTIKLKSGALEMSDAGLTGGQFEVDMTTINNLDLSGEYKDKLEGHLKSDDFFSVANHPTAQLVFKEVTKRKDQNVYVVVGALTIKNITHPITFDLEMNANEATTKVVVDRSKYDVRFRSASFFENLGDKLIFDDFELDVKLVF